MKLLGCLAVPTRYVLAMAFVNAAALAFVVMVGAAAAEPVRILALGDSLTAGYGLARQDSFPARLQAALGRRGIAAEVINAGVSGDTTAGGRARLEWALADAPAVAIVELGANDGLRGLDPEATFANLDAIVRRLKAARVAVLLTGMKAPPNLGAEYGAAFNAVFPRIAEKHGVAFHPFFLDGVAAEPELNQDDGIHPNAAGVKIIVERLLPFVVDVIEKARPAD